MNDKEAMEALVTCGRESDPFPRRPTSIDEVIEHLLGQMDHSCGHPKMFAVSAEEIMAVLWCYHTIWAYAAGRVRDYLAAFQRVREEEGYGVYPFDWHYKHKLCARDTSEHAAISYVIEQWRKVDGILGIKFPERPRPRQSAGDTPAP